MKNIGKPCAGEPHARFDEGGQVRACSLLYPFKGVDGQFLFYQIGLNKERYKGLGIGSTFLEVNKRDTEGF